jgi:hypothetical protein
MSKKDRAVVAFVVGTVVSAIVNKALDKEADALGVPHVVVGLVVAVIAHELG